MYKIKSKLFVDFIVFIIKKNYTSISIYLYFILFQF